MKYVALTSIILLYADTPHHSTRPVAPSTRGHSGGNIINNSHHRPAAAPSPLSTPNEDTVFGVDDACVVEYRGTPLTVSGRVRLTPRGILSGALGDFEPVRS